MVMGYDIEGIVGKNVTEMMENALAQVGLNTLNPTCGFSTYWVRKRGRNSVII